MQKHISSECREHRLLFRGEVPSQEPEAKEQQPRQKAGFDAQEQTGRPAATRENTSDNADNLKAQLSPERRKLVDSARKNGIEIRGSFTKARGVPEIGVYLFKKGKDAPVFKDTERSTGGDLLQALQIHNDGDGADALSTEDLKSIQQLSSSGKVAAYAKNPDAFNGPALDEVKKSIMKDLGITEPILLMANRRFAASPNKSAFTVELSVVSSDRKRILATVHMNERGQLDAIIQRPKFQELPSASLLSLVANATGDQRVIGKIGTKIVVAPIIVPRGSPTGYLVELSAPHAVDGEMERLSEVEFDLDGKIVKATKLPRRR